MKRHEPFKKFCARSRIVGRNRSFKGGQTGKEGGKKAGARGIKEKRGLSLESWQRLSEDSKKGKGNVGGASSCKGLASLSLATQIAPRKGNVTEKRKVQNKVGYSEGLSSSIGARLKQKEKE